MTKRHGIRLDRQRLKVLMDLREMTEKALSEKMGMSLRGLQDIKMRESTHLHTVGTLAEALDCHPFDLIVAEGYPAPFLARQDAR